MERNVDPCSQDGQERQPDSKRSARNAPPPLGADEQSRLSHLRLHLIGDSPALQKLLQDINSFAMFEAPVLITGETGTGKELVAQAVHSLSVRANCPLIVINCGRHSDSLFESELFGHERGAFTGAETRKQGLLAAAHKGFFFFDEVDSLSPRAQVMILRALEDNEVRPLGSCEKHRSDVRFIAATNTSLQDLVNEGQFRQDLFFRLEALRISLPPLRERGNDPVILARHFLSAHAAKQKEPVRELAPEAEATLLAYRWPGNVRELQRAIMRGIAKCRGHQISTEDLGLPRHDPPTGYQVADSITYSDSRRLVLDDFHRCYLADLLRKHHGNVTASAISVKLDRRDLQRLLSRYHFLAEDYR